MPEKNNGFIQDGDGNKSSKRASGLILVLLGIVCLCVLAFKSFSLLVPGAEMIYKIGVSFLAAGGGLLGVGVFEKMRK
jgi:hypothetical protein